MTESYPPEMPEDSNAYQSGSRYDSRTVWWTVGIVVLMIAVGTWLVPFIGLAVPVVLLVSLFFLAAKNQSVRYRSVLAGLLIGLGVGLLITAGLCTAIFSGNLPSPLFPSP